MDNNVYAKYSSHLCAKCGGSAPHWKCAECGLAAGTYDPRHFITCPYGAKMQARCDACNEAESKCTCPPVPANL